MGTDVEADVVAAVRAAIAKADSRIIEIEAIVDALWQAYPDLAWKDIAERVVFAVAAYGAAAVWPRDPPG